MAKALITGATGFIGSHLVEFLKQKGVSTMALKHEKLQERWQLKDILTDYKPDYIFHLAAFGNMHHQKDVRPIFQSNIHATFNLLEASLHIPYSAFINIGSSSEYGKKEEPMIEEMLPETTTLYGASKVASTYLCRAFAKTFTKPIVTVRPFSVYGVGEAQFRFIPTIIKHLQSQKVMDFDQLGVHDWIYIDDLISGIGTIVDNARVLSGEVVNIGTGIQTSNIVIEKMLAKLAGKSLNVNYFNNMRPDDSPVWVDGSRKLRLLGWKPQVSLEEGLKRCYEYYTK